MKDVQPKSVARRVLSARRKLFEPNPDRWLRQAHGVLHVGANSGQERDAYESLGLHVAWVEPIPSVFDELVANISGFPRQRAFRYLITDEDGRKYTFHIASNSGASSSILDLHLHRQIWTDVSYTADVEMTGFTLETFVKKEGIAISRYDTLVLDTQGSEMLVLRGAANLLANFRFIKTEAADFEAYKDCCRARDLEHFLGAHGFREVRRKEFAALPDGAGRYYDILFQRAS